MADVFISYSHSPQDSDYAHKLENALRKKDFSAWIDDRIYYGAQWPKAIEEQLEQCAALIVIMTPRSERSEWVQKELARAQRRQKAIFPLLLEGTEPWFVVETTQYVDVRTGKLPPKRFYKRLRQAVSAQRVIRSIREGNYRIVRRPVEPEHKPDPRGGLLPEIRAAIRAFREEVNRGSDETDEDV